MKTLSMKFVTDANKPYRINLAYAAETIESEAGIALVKKAIKTILTGDALKVSLTGSAGAEVIERRLMDLA